MQSVLSLLVVVIAAMLLAVAASGSATDDYAPSQLHVQLGSSPSEVFVTFVTAKQAQTSRISIGTASGNVAFNVTAMQHSYCNTGVCGDVWEGSIHQTRLTGLSADTLYFYRAIAVDHDFAEHVSKEFSFRTMIPGGDTRAFSFIMVADQDTTEDAQQLTQRMQEWLQAQPQSQQPRFWLLPGDLSYADEDESVWDTYATMVEPIQANLLVSASAGNHEVFHEFAGYLNRYQFPSTSNNGASKASPFAYSYDTGLVHIVHISPDADVSPGSAQYAWLEQDLIAANARRHLVPWLVVASHEPVYCSATAHSCVDDAPKYNPILEPLYLKYGVDVVFSGHMHAVEWTLPVVKGEVAGDYTSPQGPVHVIAGCGGRKLDTKWQDQPKWSSYREEKVGFLKVDVTDANSMTVTFWNCGSSCGKDLYERSKFTLKTKHNWANQYATRSETKFRGD